MTAEPDWIAADRATSFAALATNGSEPERWSEEWEADYARSMQTGRSAALAAVDAHAAAAKAVVYRHENNAAAGYVDWAKFWARDHSDRDWLLDDVLARGRGHAFYARQKEGKSEFQLWCVLEILENPNNVVIYLDYEMGEDDLYDRLVDFGYGPDSDLTRLRYALLPSLPPLDTTDGGYVLCELVDALTVEYPGHHVVVVIDTTGRAVSGDENSADTIRAFYRHTGIGLKQRGVTWARLDHAGKDADRGQRGSSAKGDDVDIVWRLARTDGGAELHRDAARPSWVPERVAFQRVTDPDLRYIRVAHVWPAGTKEVAELLDTLDVPADAGERTAMKALRDEGHRRRNDVIRAAIRWRRASAEATE
jgi:hypothetical protein